MKQESVRKMIVVTGATAGIGLATATLLARQGAYVLGIGRSLSRCNQAEEIIKKACPEAQVAFQVADLSSQKQIKELAAKHYFMYDRNHTGRIKQGG